MQELEKILEEMREASVFAKNHDGCVAECVTIGMVERILRKHMDDGWVPVDIPVDKKCIPLGDVIACDRYGNLMIGCLEVRTNLDVICDNDESFLTDIVAWRPLPEPYRPERSEGE